MKASYHDEYLTPFPLSQISNNINFLILKSNIEGRPVFTLLTPGISQECRFHARLFVKDYLAFMSAPPPSTMLFQWEI